MNVRSSYFVGKKYISYFICNFESFVFLIENSWGFLSWYYCPFHTTYRNLPFIYKSITCPTLQIDACMGADTEQQSRGILGFRESMEPCLEPEVEVTLLYVNPVPLEEV